MAKIISKRGQKPPVQPVESPVAEVEFFVIDMGCGGYQLTEEELDHVRKVFEGIRKQLDSVVRTP